jgi:acyl-CoA synthetase (AMP-forming)/AMP-acid ligase II
MDVVLRALQRAGSSTSIAVQQGASRFTYKELLNGAEGLRQAFHLEMRETIDQRYAPRVGCVCDAGSEYVVSMWSAWLQGSIFVPLAPTHPKSLLEYEIEDARLSMVRITLHSIDWAS